MFFKNRADNLALDALAAAVNDADFGDSSSPALLQILLHHAGYILGRKGVEIDGVLYGKDDWLGKGGIYVRIARRIL